VFDLSLVDGDAWEARLALKIACQRGYSVLVGVSVRLIAVGVAALSVGICIKAGGTRGTDQGNASNSFHAAFDDRFFFRPNLASFAERFKGEPFRFDAVIADNVDRNGAGSSSVDGKIFDTDDEVAENEGRVNNTPPTLSTDDFVRHLQPPDVTANERALAGLERRVAVYDISAHTVYLPDGRKLEAHSGLGNRIDDPRFVNVRGHGATPPNIYDLTLREHAFHGVHALRLTPVGEGKMFGRDGILAHSYMLGPSGQSNGCVVFSNYPAFLNAYLTGEIERLAVVDHLPSDLAPKVAARHFPEWHRHHDRQS
jgi:hypothetical protein